MAVCVAVAALGGISPIGLTQNWDMTLLLTSCAAAIGVSVVLRSSGEGSYDRLAGVSAGLVVAYVLWASVSASQSAQPWSAFFGAPATSLGVAQIALVACLFVAAMTRAEETTTALLGVAPVLLGLEVAYVAAQALAGMSPTSTSNATFFAQIAVLCLPLTLVPALEGRGVVWRSLLAAATLVALGAVGTRVGVVLSVFIAGFFMRARMRDARAVKRPWLAWGSFSVAAVAGVALSWDRIVRLVDPVSALGSRPMLWEAAVDVWSRDSLLGVGPEGFRTAVATGADAAFLREGVATTGFSTLPGDPHAMPLLIAVTTGVVGLFIATVWAASLVTLWRRARVSDRSRTRWLIAACVGYATTSMLAPVTIQTLPLAALVLGASASGGADRERSDTPRRVVWRTAAALGLVAALSLTSISATRLVVGRLDRVSLADAERVSAAARVWRHDPLLHYAASWRWYEAALRGTGPIAWEESLDHARRAAELEPGEPVYSLNVATTLAAIGAPRADVESAFERALTRMPASVESHVAYGGYLLSQGDAAGALVHVEEALAAGDSVPWVHALAAEVYAGLGDAEQAAWHRLQEERLTASGPG